MLFKGLIIPSLIIFFVIGRAKTHYKEDKIIIAALVFSWVGDIFLQIKTGGDMFFLAGLISFLTTHILYTIVFFGTTGIFIFQKTKRLLLLIIILYGALTIYTILPGLGNMQIPVTIYGIVITGMVISAVSRFGKVNDSSYLIVFFGALLFLISDSLIAFNRFKQPFPVAALLIMITYIFGQFLIIAGTLKQYSEKLLG